MLDKYKQPCEICQKSFLKYFMKQKDKYFICNSCFALCNNLNSCNDSIYKYTIEELQKSVTQNNSIIKIRREEHIKERKKQYLETLYSIKMLSPTISKNAIKKQFLKDIPPFNYSQVRKNIPQYKLENFVSIDIETTGLYPASNEIIEISAVKFINGDPIECLTTLIRPKKEITEEITIINNITNEMVINSPQIENVISSFSSFINGFNVVGYNLDFDLRFLHVNGMDFFSEKRQFYDALDLARKLYKYKLDNFKLDTVANEMELYRTQAHRATEDALVTGIIFRDLGNYMKTH